MVMQDTYLKKQSSKFNKLVTSLGEVGSLRNQVVHADWESAFEDGYTRCKLKINSHGIQYEYLQFTPESLEKIKELIDETYTIFDEYWEEYVNE